MVSGVPQGSVLGPLLYVIYMHDIPLPSTPQTLIQIYADDTAIFTTSYSEFQCSIRMQSYLDLLVEYFKNWNIKINPTKTQLVYFYPTYKYQNKLKKAVPVNIEKHMLKNDKSANYLGITLANKLCFKQHILNIRRKTAFAFNILYPVLSSSSGLDANNKLLIYKLYNRPIFLYAAPAWYKLLNKTQKKVLQKTQNKALNFVFNKWSKPPDFHRCSINILHDMAQILRVVDFTDRLISNAICKLMTSTCEIMNEIAHKY